MSSLNVNLSDPRQDIHRERTVRPMLNRFRIAEILLRQTRTEAGAEILELGGGAAEFSLRMRILGYRINFVDLSESNVARATNLNFQAHQMDLNLGLPTYKDCRFDGAVMLEIIEHIVGAEQLLNEVYRVLKPGGFLILSTPNFAYLSNRLRILFGHLSQDEGYHYRFFTPSVLQIRLKNAGFNIERTAHTTPAIGYNFITRVFCRGQRKHVRVPDVLAPLMAHTLFVRARKPLGNS